MKPFKETKVGKFLKEKLPQAAELAGDVLPDSGVFGIIKNAIGGSKLSPEDKEEAMRLLMEEERMFMEDRANARNREIELAKAGKMDWMMKVIGLSVMVAFFLAIIVVFFYEVKNENMAHLILGEIMGFVSGVIFYYFGSSQGSSDKTKLMLKK